MKKIPIITFLISLSTLYSSAQENAGVQFIKALSWQQITDKARTEHKYIFVDCYATWCGPCKFMDKNIYPQKEAGDALNPQFICIRVQMDRTAKDNDTVKSGYAMAAQLEKDYDVHAYPTFLFFNPEGVAVHKVAGSEELKGFIKTVENATDPGMQYYTLLKAYQGGQLDYAQILVLSNEAKGINDKLSAEVATNYLQSYLDKLPPGKMLTKENVDFLNEYKALVTSNDAFFKLCLNEPARTDTLVHDKGFAQGWIGDVAYQEVLAPMMKAGEQNGPEPDWDKAKKEMDRQFGKDYSSRNIINARIDWYFYKKDGPDYAKYIVKAFNNVAERWQSPPVGLAAWGFNNSAFEVFQYDHDKADLETALNWMERINAAQDKPNPEMLDTEANLLYKLGKKDAAITLEAKAAEISPGAKDIAETLIKMKAGQPTWPDKME